MNTTDLNIVKIAHSLAPNLTEKFAAEEEGRKLPTQSKNDLLYYPNVGQHAIAAGLTTGALPMLGLAMPHPVVGATTALGVYGGGKIGRGIGATLGYPNAGALAGEVLGGTAGFMVGKHAL